MDSVCYKNIMCGWVHTCKAACCKQTLQKRRIPQPLLTPYVIPFFPGKDYTEERNINSGLRKNSVTAFTSRMMLIFANVCVKGDGWREEELPLNFEAVEEGLIGQYRKASFENERECRKRTEEQKTKHQDGKVWVETLKGKCPETVPEKWCLFWYWCDQK